MSDTPKSDPEIDLVRKHATELGEHFETVQIFVTRHDAGGEGGTVNIQLGSGNWFARRGQIDDWIIQNEEESRVHVRKNREG